MQNDVCADAIREAFGGENERLSGNLEDTLQTFATEGGLHAEIGAFRSSTFFALKQTALHGNAPFWWGFLAHTRPQCFALYVDPLSPSTAFSPEALDAGLSGESPDLDAINEFRIARREVCLKKFRNAARRTDWNNTEETLSACWLMAPHKPREEQPPKCQKAFNKKYSLGKQG
ncbi:MAG: hypothetical protein H2040_04765 [Euryhalocaulis sp.]|uniref:hypothetical protein n=1 Tax=Euryhalocaulis sp. TaxID=2744307 RepID=UPI0017947A52|nr:hypothetical protein [Euryhalocaulis sp.]MBA4801153.1 hypothetical protein [Euryhalocaulis sp.]